MIKNNIQNTGAILYASMVLDSSPLGELNPLLFVSVFSFKPGNENMTGEVVEFAIFYILRNSPTHGSSRGSLHKENLAGRHWDQAVKNDFLRAAGGCCERGFRSEIG